MARLPSLEQTSVQRVLERIEAHSQLVAAGLESYVSTARADVAVFRSAAELNGNGQSDLPDDFLTAPPIRTLAVRVSLGY